MKTEQQKIKNFLEQQNQKVRNTLEKECEEHKKDLITLDFRLKQVRYVRYDIPKIEFIDLSNDDTIGYEYLFKNDLKGFKECIKDCFKDNLNIDLSINNMEMRKWKQNR